MAHAALMSSVFYRDPRAAIDFLQRALGFELVMLIEDDAGNVVHSELKFGGSSLSAGGEWSADHQSPASVEGRNTQTVRLYIDSDIQAHFEQARAAGAEILMAPETQFYGDRTYRCRDPEGHIWTVAQSVAAVTREEAEAATGLKITGWV